jgi:GT2 family glycosyltransferase
MPHPPSAQPLTGPRDSTPVVRTRSRLAERRTGHLCRVHFTPVRPDRVVVVVPAHNEVQLLDRCLAALRSARAASPIPVRIVVVLDSCTDGTSDVVGTGVHVVETDVHNVGSARAIGFRAAGVTSSASTWCVSTDADSVVDRDYFRSLALCARDAHVVAGPVRVSEWAHRSVALAQRYQRDYAAEHSRGLRHVHGANLAVRADAYRSVGGFRPLGEHEDVDLVDRLERRGFRVRSEGAPSVITSARSSRRTAGGFASFLDTLAEETDPPAITA